MSFDGKTMHRFMKKTGSINLASGTAQNFITVAKLSAIEDIWIRIINATTATAPTISIGRSVASYTDYCVATALTGLTSSGLIVSMRDVLGTASPLHGTFAAGSTLAINVTVASAGTLDAVIYTSGFEL